MGQSRAESELRRWQKVSFVSSSVDLVGTRTRYEGPKESLKIQAPSPRLRGEGRVRGIGYGTQYGSSISQFANSNWIVVCAIRYSRSSMAFTLSSRFPVLLTGTSPTIR